GERGRSGGIAQPWAHDGLPSHHDRDDSKSPAWANATDSSRGTVGIRGSTTRTPAGAGSRKENIAMTTRRGNNEGSITKRPDGRWEARISLDKGKGKSFFGRTRQEAVRKLTEALRDRDKGLPIVGERQTVAQYAAAWLGMVEPTIGAT